jgi:hypothetical protein
MDEYSEFVKWSLVAIIFKKCTVKLSAINHYRYCTAYSRKFYCTHEEAKQNMKCKKANSILLSCLAPSSACNVVFFNLLVRVIGLLHTAFLKSEVIVKQEQQKMPQGTTLIQVCLQPEVDGKCADTFGNHLTQLGNVLRR